MELFIIIILIIINFSLLYFLFMLKKKSSIIKKKNDNIDKENQTLEKINNELKIQRKQLNDEKTLLSEQIAQLKEQYDTNTQWADEGFSNYCNVLDAAYVKKEIEIDHLIQILNNNYDAERMEKEEELNKLNEELNRVKATISATISAQEQEEKVKANLDFYCLKLSLQDINDISVLERIKSQLNQPRILSMLIWTTFYRDKMNNLCSRVVGNKVVCGIYKITNQVNGKAYIGQSVDISSRWKQHAKKGLGIDSSSTTLYNEMQEFGLYNFSWEILEICKSEELNEKEKYFIDLYSTDKTGLNSKGGNSK